MVELKFKDTESLSAVSDALRKSGYKHSTFIVWAKKAGEIDRFTIRIEDVDNG